MSGLYVAAAFWLLVAISSTWFAVSRKNPRRLSHLGFAVFQWSIVVVAFGAAFTGGRPPNWLLLLFICGLLGGLLVALVGERLGNYKEKRRRQQEDDDDPRWKDAIREL
jgi:hypothetical protein